jgi:hypothetical protein
MLAKTLFPLIENNNESILANAPGSKILFKNKKYRLTIQINILLPKHSSQLKLKRNQLQQPNLVLTLQDPRVLLFANPFRQNDGQTTTIRWFGVDADS